MHRYTFLPIVYSYILLANSMLFKLKETELTLLNHSRNETKNSATSTWRYL